MSSLAQKIVDSIRGKEHSPATELPSKPPSYEATPRVPTPQELKDTNVYARDKRIGDLSTGRGAHLTTTPEEVTTENELLFWGRATAGDAGTEAPMRQVLKVHEDAITGRPVSETKRHEGAILAVAFAPNGSFLVTGSADKTAKIWPVSQGKLRGKQLTLGSTGFAATSSDDVGHARSVTAVRVDQDSLLVITGSEDGALIIWGVDGSRKLAIERHGATVNGIAVAPNNLYIATAGSDKRVYIWDVKEVMRQSDSDLVSVPRGGFTDNVDTKIKEYTRFARHRGAVLDVAWGPSSTWLVSGEYESLFVWTMDGLVIRKIEGHAGNSVTGVAIERNKGDWFVSVGNDASLNIWSTETGDVLKHWRTSYELRALAVSPNARWIATNGASGEVVIWDLTQRSAVHEFGYDMLNNERDFEHKLLILGLALHPDGDLLASSDAEGKVILWDVTSHNVIRVLEPAKPRPRQEEHKVDALCIDHTGNILARGGRDGLVNFYSLSSGNLVASRDTHLSGLPLGQKHEGAVWSISMNKAHAISVSSQKAVIWKLQSCEVLSEIPIVIEQSNIFLDADRPRIFRVALAPSGAWFACASEENCVLLYNESSKSPKSFNMKPTVLTPPEEAGAMTALAISPKEDWIAAGGENTMCYVWELKDLDKDKKPRFALDGHTNRLWALAASPSGTWLASGGSGNKIILWEYIKDDKRWREFRQLACQPEGVRALRISKHGTWIAAAGYERNVVVFRPSPSTWSYEDALVMLQGDDPTTVENTIHLPGHDTLTVPYLVALADSATNNPLLIPELQRTVNLSLRVDRRLGRLDSFLFSANALQALIGNCLERGYRDDVVALTLCAVLLGNLPGVAKIAGSMAKIIAKDFPHCFAACLMDDGGAALRRLAKLDHVPNTPIAPFIKETRRTGDGARAVLGPRAINSRLLVTFQMAADGSTIWPPAHVGSASLISLGFTWSEVVPKLRGNRRTIRRGMPAVPRTLLVPGAAAIQDTSLLEMLLVNPGIPPQVFQSDAVRAVTSHHWRAFGWIIAYFLITIQAAFITAFTITSFTLISCDVNDPEVTVVFWPALYAQTGLLFVDFVCESLQLLLTTGAFTRRNRVFLIFDFISVLSALCATAFMWEFAVEIPNLDCSVGDPLRDGLIISTAIGGVAAWLRLLSFLASITLFAAFTDLTTKALVASVPFTVILLIVLLGFTHGQLILLIDSGRGFTDEEAERDFTKIVQLLWSLILWRVDSATFSQPDYLLSILTLFTAGIVALVALNLLISIVSDSYDRVRDEQRYTMVRQRARFIHFTAIPLLKPLLMIFGVRQGKERNTDDNSAEQIDGMPFSWAYDKKRLLHCLVPDLRMDGNEMEQETGEGRLFWQGRLQATGKRMERAVERYGGRHEASLVRDELGDFRQEVNDMMVKTNAKIDQIRELMEPMERFMRRRRGAKASLGDDSRGQESVDVASRTLSLTV